MPQQNRRVAFGDEAIRTRGLSLRSIQRLDYGTRAMGAAYAGTVSFKHGAFVGTPTVLISMMARRTLSIGSNRPDVGVITRASGSFTWQGTPKGGTFIYAAIGSQLP